MSIEHLLFNTKKEALNFKGNLVEKLEKNKMNNILPLFYKIIKKQKYFLFQKTCQRCRLMQTH